MAKSIDLSNPGTDGDLVATQPGDGADQFVGNGASPAIIVAQEDPSGPSLQWAWLQTQYASASTGVPTPAVGQNRSTVSTAPTLAPTLAATPLGSSAEPTLPTIGGDTFAVLPTATAPQSKAGAAQTGLTINLVYDPAALAAPQSFRDGMQAAANLLQAAIADKITVNIAVGYGEFNGTPLTNQNFSEGGVNTTTGETYSKLRTLLVNHETSAADVTSVNALPNTTSLNGTTNFFISSSEAKAFGLISGTGSTIDGFVGMGTQFTGTTLLGGALHEITHAMGRIPGTSVLSLVRYDSVGNHDFTGGTPAASTYFSIDGGNTKLADFGRNSDTSDFLNSGPLTPNDPFDETIAGSTLTSVDLTMMDVLGFQLTCFCRGTMILGEGGEVAVEDLKVGDRVVTLSGALKPIRWIGMALDLVTRINRTARPVIVRQGALAAGVPHRDLYLTHGHALYLDSAIGGVLIPVENLVNHRSIVWDETARVVEHYHIELEDHDVVLAEGAPAETYYDANNRAQFHTAREGSAAVVAKPSFAPVLNGGDIVDRVWAELFERSGGRIETDTTDAPDLHLVIDGARLDPQAIDGAAYTFAVAAPPSGPLHLRSRSGVPSLLGITRHDHRRLGVALARLELRLPGIVTSIEHDAPILAEAGCYPPESGHCWTDGEATLPALVFAHLAGPFTLTVHTELPGLRYPLADRLAQAA